MVAKPVLGTARMCVCAQPGWLEDAGGSEGCLKSTGTRRWIQPAQPCSNDSWPRESTEPLLSMKPSLQEQHLSSCLMCGFAVGKVSENRNVGSKKRRKKRGEKEKDKHRLEFREGLVPTLLRI